jgi:hypothetical protein
MTHACAVLTTVLINLEASCVSVLQVTFSVKTLERAEMLMNVLMLKTKQVSYVLMSVLTNLGVLGVSVLRDLYSVQISGPAMTLMSVSVVMVKMIQVTVVHMSV